MKLLVVGSSPQSNIYLSSQFVSGYHAEIILLDNGDILLCDKNSTNGTTLNGSKVTPGVEVRVARGANVVFADTPLDWSKVPELRPEDAKKIINYGSHSANQVHVAGDKVSRFHATVKQSTNGKWFICDHSTNGTTLNNIRIPKDTYVKLKASDTIKCAGVPVHNPVPSSKWWKYAVAAVAACAVVAGVIFGVTKIGGGDGTSSAPMTGEKIYKTFSPSTVIIYLGYHYKISAGSLDIDEAFGASEFVVIDNHLVPYSEKEDNSQDCFATGFYISKDGLIATNLHVAQPWMFDQNVQPVEDLARIWLNDLSKISNPNYANYISQVKVEGVVDYMYAIPHGQYFDGHNAMSCTEVVSSSDTKIDVAIVRAMLPNKELQKGTKYVHLSTIPDKSFYKSGVDVVTMGFPMAIMLQDIENKSLEAVYAEGSINKIENDYVFGHSINLTNGASGSPVFNRNGQLIGIVSSGYGNGYNFAVRAEYLKKLLDQKEIAYE